LYWLLTVVAFVNLATVFSRASFLPSRASNNNGGPDSESGDKDVSLSDFVYKKAGNCAPYRTLSRFQEPKKSVSGFAETFL
jgi:hypothetical protein